MPVTNKRFRAENAGISYGEGVNLPHRNIADTAQTSTKHRVDRPLPARYSCQNHLTVTTSKHD
jgi:hypothetical protein